MRTCMTFCTVCLLSLSISELFMAARIWLTCAIVSCSAAAYGAGGGKHSWCSAADTLWVVLQRAATDGLSIAMVCQAPLGDALQKLDSMDTAST